MADSVMRYQVADYLGIDNTFALMGVGFNTLDENPSAQTDGKTYISQKAQTSQVKGYQPSFPFDTDLIKDEAAVMALYDVGRNQRTGADAEKDYVRVELFRPVSGKQNTFMARKFRVAVQVDSISGEGGGVMKCAGNLLGVGDFIDGEFNTSTQVFTETGGTLGELTVTSAAGTASGATKLTVSPTKASGNSYKYKTAASVTLPAYDEVCSAGYTGWDGTADITATTGQKILVVEVDSSNKAKKAGIATVTSKT